jgi:hypothetical protein
MRKSSAVAGRNGADRGYRSKAKAKTREAFCSGNGSEWGSLTGFCAMDVVAGKRF